MALDVKPDNLREEVRAATEYGSKFYKEIDTLTTRFAGRYYRHDRQPDRPMIDNHAFEFLSILLPTVIYDNPRCRVSSRNINQKDEQGAFTMGDMAKGIELFLNRWSEDSELAAPLYEMAIDFFFGWSAALVTIADQPGYQGLDLLPPQTPRVIRLAPKHFIMDAAAMTWDVMQSGGPRFLGNMWRADKEDLLKDDDYNHDAVKQLVDDDDLKRYDEERFHTTDIPSRREILAWDIWVPEKKLTIERGYNGAIYTIGVGSDPRGETKKARYIRDPRPAYAPPWGPYIVGGCYKVPNMPYPLGPLTATAEQAEDVNAHAVAMSEDARSYKNFGYSQSGDDGERIRDVRNGEFITLDDPDNAGQMEIGGVKDPTIKYSDIARERLNRISGLSDALRGEVTGDITATESSIADSGTKMRMSGMKRQFRRFVAQVFKSAAWFVFHGEDMHMSLGIDGQRSNMSSFTGGVSKGRGKFNFHDLSLSIDPLSTEHTDQALLQRRVQLAYESLVNSAPSMTQLPWLKWDRIISTLFETLNIADADDWVDFEMLAMYQNMMQSGAMAPQEGEEVEGQPTTASTGDQAGLPSTESGRAGSFMARETGRLGDDSAAGAG